MPLSSVRTPLAAQWCVRHPLLLLLGRGFHSAALPRLRLALLTGKVRLGMSLCSLEKISSSRYASCSPLVMLVFLLFYLRISAILIPRPMSVSFSQLLLFQVKTVTCCVAVLEEPMCKEPKVKVLQDHLLKYLVTLNHENRLRCKHFFYPLWIQKNLEVSHRGFAFVAASAAGQSQRRLPRERDGIWGTGFSWFPNLRVPQRSSSDRFQPSPDKQKSEMKQPVLEGSPRSGGLRCGAPHSC